MDLKHCVQESELETHVDLFGFPLECAKEEWKRQLKESFCSSTRQLEARAQDVLLLRRNPEKIQTSLAALRNLAASEKLLLSHVTNETSKTAEEQVFFTGEHTKCLNTIPWLLTALVFLKIYVAPFLALLTPLILFVMPYVMMNTIMGTPIPWEMYYPMMKHMIFGVAEGQPWGLKQYSQALWTLVSLGQGMVMPWITAYHTKKLDTEIVARGRAIQDLCRVGHQVAESYKALGIKSIHLTMPEAPSDPREAVAWITHERLVLKIVRKLLGQLTILTVMADDPQWQQIHWGQKNLTLENFTDLAISPAVGISSNVSLSTHSLLTGPNRGGKSSSLRAILQQVLLGQTFGMTYRTTGSWIPFRHIFTRLKSKDHAGKESLFEMEVRMASHMLHTTKQSGQHTLLLIDELFHSTNPPDAEISAKLFLQRLWGLSNAKSVISTHIFSLCEAPGHEGIQTLCCYAEERTDGSIQYNYRLSEGICRTSSVREVLQEAGLLRA